MPVNDRYPLDEVLAECRRYVELRHRRVFVEYVMLAGVNDAAEQAEELARVLDPAGVQGEPDPVQPDRDVRRLLTRARSRPSRRARPGAAPGDRPAHERPRDRRRVRAARGRARSRDLGGNGPRNALVSGSGRQSIKQLSKERSMRRRSTQILSILLVPSSSLQLRAAGRRRPRRRPRRPPSPRRRRRRPRRARRPRAPTPPRRPRASGRSHRPRTASSSPISVSSSQPRSAARTATSRSRRRSSRSSQTRPRRTSGRTSRPRRRVHADRERDEGRRSHGRDDARRGHAGEADGAVAEVPDAKFQTAMQHIETWATNNCHA